MSYIYHTFFFDPLYNALVLLFTTFSWVDAGVGIIILTILVRLAIYPLSKKAVVTQIRIAEISPELEKIKEKHKDNPEEQARKTLELYREKKVNPFSGIFVILIQLPIIFALYQIFLHFPEVNAEILYSFVQAPESITTTFLGFINVTAKSIPLALLAAVSTFFQFRISMKSQPKPKGNSFGDNLARSMQVQMKYVFPVIVFFISYSISGAIAIYWVTANLFGIAQELYIRKNVKPASSV